MKIVFQKAMLKLFFYWINERHRIWVARTNKENWPWTSDKILQEYKFTNVFRQLDRVTVEWTNRYTTLIGQGKKVSPGLIFFHCCLFRLFNWPPTYDALYFGIGSRWDMKKALEILKARQESGDDEKSQIFTGAYIIPNAGSTDPKIKVICKALDYIWDHRDDYAARIMKANSLERTVNILQNIYTIGPFIAYEIACDLRFTKLLVDATDKLSWANPGPGAKRGIHRLMTGKHKWPKGDARPNYVKAMRMLLVMAQEEDVLEDHMEQGGQVFEMREIEHSLCEYDKYMRVKNGEGRPRSRYAPVLQQELALDFKHVNCCKCGERHKNKDDHCPECDHRYCGKCRGTKDQKEAA